MPIPFVVATRCNGRTPSDASGRPCPASRCAANVASPARAATIVSTALDLTASGAARCAALENSELVTQSRNLGLHSSAGLKRRADQGNKCDENRTHLESDDNLSNRRNVFLISPDEVLGMHRTDHHSAMLPPAIRPCLSPPKIPNIGTVRTCGPDDTSVLHGISFSAFGLVNQNFLVGVPLWQMESSRRFRLKR